MISATIEPCFFAPPPGPLDASSLRDYIAALLHWAEIASARHVEVLISRATQEVLITTNSFPLRPWLRQMLAQAAIVEYDANTVARLAETLFSRSSILEDRVSILDLLFESLTLVPSIVSPARAPRLRWEAEKVAIILAIMNAFAKGPEAHTYCLVTGSNPGTRLVSIHCQIAAIEHHRNDLVGLPQFPAYFTGNTRVASRFIDCVLAMDEGRALQAASNLGEVVDAIRIAVCKFRISNGQTGSSLALPQFSFNRHFMTCLKTCGVFTNLALARSTLRSIVEILENVQMANVHALRSGAGADDPQVTRGSDSAWRRDIDHQYHLHYWQCAGNSKELACMVVHNDFHICN
jgi:hypothetical protein